MNPFTLFTNTDYDFLKIKQTVMGNEIEREYFGVGIFKLREGMAQTDNVELFANNDASLHIMPDEMFLADIESLVGNGVRVNGIIYRITSFTEGKDFDNGSIAFYRATLKREEIAVWDETPLE